MHPELFKIIIPEFLQAILPPEVTVYTYGSLIALGAILGYLYTARQARIQFEVPPHKIRSLLTFIIITAFIGGKLFYFFEDPQYFFSNPRNMLSFGSTGFVFYGSLLFAIPTMLVFFKVNNLPTLEMLDIVALSACIVHFFGRLGCFHAGCCYGLPHDGIFSIVFTDPVCRARPLDTPLHPTQLYSAFLILAIFLILMVLKSKRKFPGQLFLTYLGLYALGRSVIEIFRGDYQRGYIMGDWLSHSQFISIILLLVVGYFYIKLHKKYKTVQNS